MRTAKKLQDIRSEDVETTPAHAPLYKDGSDCLGDSMWEQLKVRHMEELTLNNTSISTYSEQIETVSGWGTYHETPILCQLQLSEGKYDENNQNVPNDVAQLLWRKIVRNEIGIN